MQKMGIEYTICFQFSKKPLGDPDSPTLLREDKKNPSWALYDPLKLRWKLSRIKYIGVLKAKITHNFGREINTNSAHKKWLRMHHLHPIFENVPGKFPGPHLQEGYPLPHPPQSGALRRFGYPPPPFPSSEPSGSATARSKNIRFTFAHWRLNASMYLRDLNHPRCLHGPVNLIVANATHGWISLPWLSL